MLAEAVGGDIAWAPNALRAEGTPVFVGVHPTTIHLLRQADLAQRPYVTLDNGYFSPYKQGGYFRATTNGLQWTRRADVCIDDPDAQRRFDAHGQSIQPWRTSGSHILLVLQTPAWFENFGLNRTRWAEWVGDRLAQVTDRRIRIREKPLKGLSHPPPPLEEDLRDCWAVVGLSSNVMVQAALMGVPVCPLAPCAASPVGTPLEQIETPLYPWRDRWAWGLAANQWTVEEMRSGRMWADLQDRYSDEFQFLGG